MTVEWVSVDHSNREHLKIVIAFEKRVDRQKFNSLDFVAIYFKCVIFLIDIAKHPSKYSIKVRISNHIDFDAKWAKKKKTKKGKMWKNEQKLEKISKS